MRTPSCNWRVGKAEVNAKGELGDKLEVPFTLNVVKPCPPAATGKPKLGPTMLFTLAKFVRLARLKPSASSCRLALSPILNRRVRRMSNDMKSGPSPVLRAAPIGRSLVEWRSPFTSAPASRLKG